MTYATSVQAGRLRELFQFNRDVSTFRFTSGPIDITALSQTWTQAPIERSEIEQTQDLVRSNLTLKFPRTNTFALEYLKPTIDKTTSVTIYSESDDNVWSVAWKGRISGASLTGDMITITCEPLTVSMRRKGLRATYQVNCRHALYHTRGCKVDRSLFAVAGTVSAVAGLVLTISAAGGFTDGEFTGGIITFNGVERFILNHVGSAITIMSAFDTSVNGQSITLYPGCDRTRSRCDTKFNNLPNHGGFADFPRRNPWNGSSIV